MKCSELYRSAMFFLVQIRMGYCWKIKLHVVVYWTKYKLHAHFATFFEVRTTNHGPFWQINNVEATVNRAFVKPGRGSFTINCIQELFLDRVGHFACYYLFTRFSSPVLSGFGTFLFYQHQQDLPQPWWLPWLLPRPQCWGRHRKHTATCSF